MSALKDLRALVEAHESIEEHNDAVPMNRLSELQAEPRAAQYREILEALEGRELVEEIARELFKRRWSANDAPWDPVKGKRYMDQARVALSVLRGER